MYVAINDSKKKMLEVGFEPTHLSIDDLKSPPLDQTRAFKLLYTFDSWVG